MRVEEIKSRFSRFQPVVGVAMTILAIATAFFPCHATEQSSFVGAVRQAQPKMVKIFGAGGVARLEGHQSGFLVSGRGHVLTAWSYVLGDDTVTVVLADGQRFDATLVSTDPRTEIALLKFDYEGNDLPHFRLDGAVPLEPGDRVLAFSNVYRVATGNEPVSVQHGVVGVIAPLTARSGGARARFSGDVYILDAMTNNPGAAGGALTDRRGRLAGMLGKELRNAESNTWLNYALPISAFVENVEAMLAGRLIAHNPADADPMPEQPLTAAALGFVLVPNVVVQTPPYIDVVRPGSPAAELGVRPDDLVVFVDDQLVPSCRAVRETLARYEQDMPVRLTVVRGDELIEIAMEVVEE